MKRIVYLLLTAGLLLAFMALPSFAEEISEEPVPRELGWCGENVMWHYENGTLTLEGFGETDNFYAGQPWQEYQGELKHLELVGDITYLGAYAFPDYDALETVSFGNGLKEIGQGAFSGCDGLKRVDLPGSFRIFGEESFSHCKNLKEFHFEGGFPKFKLNSMWDTYAKLIYPAQRPWPLEHIIQLEEAFQGRIEFLSSDGEDPYVPEEETEPEKTETSATEAVTEEPAETTVPETEGETVAETTRETEMPETAPPVTEETIPETTEEYVVLPEPQEPEKASSLPLIAALVVMLLSGGGAILAIGLLARNKKKDFAGDFSRAILEDEKKPGKTTASRKAGSASRKKGGKYQK